MSRFWFVWVLWLIMGWGLRGGILGTEMDGWEVGGVE